MKLVFTLTTMAPNILTLTGLHDSAKGAGEISTIHVNGKTKGNDTASGNVVIVFGVEKDPAPIGNITKNIDNSVNDSNDNNINSRRKDKSAIGVIDHVISDVMQPSFDSVNGNDCLLYTSPSPRDQRGSRMPSSA